MLYKLNGRLGHHGLLLATCGLLFLPSLGTAHLWDIDEGNYAEAAREMLASGDWVVPTFNFQMFIDKPPLLYWLQAIAYQLFGVNEFAARLPSALACIVSVLLTYELGRRMFSARTGLLAGLVLASSMAVAVAAQFANPDGILLACTLLTMLFFWNSYARGDWGWLWLCGLSTGLGVLTKGPVGLALPGAAIGLFLIWEGRWRLIFDWRIALGLLLFLAVTAPWHIMVGVDTDWEYLRVFYLKHNVQRFQEAFDSHSGPAYYYLGILLVGLGPWVVFLGPTCWFGLGGAARRDGEALVPEPAADRGGISRYRFLWVWITVYLIFFSLARTKLPNYILPIYPAFGLLTARFLERWRTGSITLPRWLLIGTFFLLGLHALGVLMTSLVAGGVIAVPGIRDRVEGLEWCALASVFLMLATVLGARYCLRQRRTAMIASVSALLVLYLGALVYIANSVLYRHRAPATLVRAIEPAADRDIRVASFEYFQQSLVFYCRRKVCTLDNVPLLLDFLRNPKESYVFLTSDRWNELQPHLPPTARRLQAAHDFLERGDIVVVTNR